MMSAELTQGDRITRLDLPADPRDLLDLLDLREKMMIFDKLKNNLDDYTIGYALSFIHPMEKVLDIIPVEDHDQYIMDKKNFKTLKEELEDDIAYDRWGERDENGKEKKAEVEKQMHYVIDLKKKKLYKFGRLEKPWSPGGAFWADSWSSKLGKGTVLKVIHNRECHSCVSRSHNPHVSAHFVTTLEFDMSTNTLKSFDKIDKEKERYR